MVSRPLIFGHTERCHPSGRGLVCFSNWVVFQWVKLVFFPRTSFFLRGRNRGFIRGHFAPYIQLLLRYSLHTKVPKQWISHQKQPTCHPDSFSPVRYDLQDLRATCGAFCALRHDGHVVCWGSPSVGGARAMGSAPIVGRSLVSTLGAFGVLRRILELAAWVMNDPYNQP